MRLQVGKKGTSGSRVNHDQHVKEWTTHQERVTPTELEPFLTDEEENEFKLKKNSPINSDVSEEHLLFNITQDDSELEKLTFDYNESNPSTDLNKTSSIEGEDREGISTPAKTSPSFTPVPRKQKQKLNLITKLLVAYSVGVSSYCGYELALGKDARLEGKLSEVQNMFSELSNDYSVITAKLSKQAKVGELLSTRIDEVAVTSLSDYESLTVDLKKAQGSAEGAFSIAEESKSKINSQDEKIEGISSVASAASLTSTNSMELAKSNKEILDVISKDMYELKDHADVIINHKNEASESYREYTTHINSVVADLSRNIKGVSPSSIERLIEASLNRKLENTAFSAKYQVNKDELDSSQSSNSSEILEIRAKLEKYQGQLESQLRQHGINLQKEVKEEINTLLYQMREEMAKESKLTVQTRQKQDDAIQKLFKQIELQHGENKSLTSDLSSLANLAKTLEQENRRLVESHTELQKLITKTSADNIELRKSQQDLADQTSAAIKKIQEREKTMLTTLKRVVNMINTQ